MKSILTLLLSALALSVATSFAAERFANGLKHQAIRHQKDVE